MYSLMDIDTGEILMQSYDYNLCFECAKVVMQTHIDINLAIL